MNFAVMLRVGHAPCACALQVEGGDVERETSDREEECLPIFMMLMGLEFAIACLSCIAHVSPCARFGGAPGCGWDTRDLARRKTVMENLTTARSWHRADRDRDPHPSPAQGRKIPEQCPVLCRGTEKRFGFVGRVMKGMAWGSLLMSRALSCL